MADCCRGGPCAEVFTSGRAERGLRRYLRRGVSGLDRRLVEIARRHGLAGARVVDIGGGIGAMQAELLLAGAASGEVIEVVGAYAPFARQLATAKGLSERSRFRVLDLVSSPSDAAPADLVLLNRVACCSADGLELLAVAAGMTRGALLVSFPRDVLWFRLASRAQNAVFRWRGLAYRSFVRPADDVVRAATSSGLRLVERGRTRAWEFVVVSA